MFYPEWFIRIMEWIRKHPIKTMIFIEIPIVVITSFLTTMLLG